MIELKTRGLAVRPLVWQESPDKWEWSAGDYIIYQIGYAFQVYFGGATKMLRSRKSLKKAKAFAQEHHEARITGALVELEKELNRG